MTPFFIRRRCNRSLFMMAVALIPALSLAQPAAAQTVDFVSGASVSDFACPNAPRRAPKPRTHGLAGGTDMPTEDELGALLAAPAIHAQPPIDLDENPGFDIRNAAQTHRIAFWGDSHIAAGPFMTTIKNTLLAQGISVGAHFLPPSMGRANIRLPELRAYCVGNAWLADVAFTSPTVLQTGPALINRVATAAPDSYFWLDLRDAKRQAVVRQLQISYRAPAGGTISIAVNDGPENRVALTPSNESRTLTLRGDALISTVKMRLTQGQMTLHGFIIDHAQPPDVTLDVFGLPSATAHGWANIDTGYLASTLQGASYDGVVLEYGTNEGNTRHFDPDKYADGLTQALTNMRAVFPQASCLLVGPPDRGLLVTRSSRKKHGSGNRVTYDFLMYSQIHQKIEAIQRHVGERFNCAAWNWQALMGGEGGSYGWARAKPALMGHDLTHLSGEGYKRTGEALARSLGWGKP